MRDSKPPTARCRQAIEIHHRVLDGDLLDAARLVELDEHLAGCPSCAEETRSLSVIQQGLRGLPIDELPEDVLGQVWERTSRSRRPARVSARWRDWRVAAAAVLAVVMVGGLWWQRQVRAEASRAELTRAAAETRMVLMLTAKALRKSERTAVRAVMTEVSPALERVPIRWPAAPRDAADPASGSPRRSDKHGV